MHMKEVTLTQAEKKAYVQPTLEAREAIVEVLEQFSPGTTGTTT
jgi:hypothetical protein